MASWITGNVESVCGSAYFVALPVGFDEVSVCHFLFLL